MKRNAKQNGSGGCLRLALLMASVAALLLVPAAGASAATNTHIIFAGEGSGWVKGAEGAEGGVPNVNCHWNGSAIDTGTPEAGKCETEAQNLGGITGITVVHQADPGSEFAGWEVQEGNPFNCAPQAAACTVLFPPIKIKATFIPEPPKFPLNVTKNGSGNGTVTSSPAGINCGVDCSEEFKENSVVTLTGTPATGSEPVVWESCPGTVNGENECEVTMDAAKEAVASFDLQSIAFTVSQEGEGTVQCNGEACAEAYDYGTLITVVATPQAEWAIASLTGTGSAAGQCDKETGICEFTITESSSVSAAFKSEALRDAVEGEVFGEVPQTTSLESACSSVYLGEFLPGVTDDYSNTCGLTLTSTGAETELTAADESETNIGHLVQGSYVLPSPLEAKATDSESKGTGPGLTSLASPATLLTFAEPVSKDAATVEFNQHIDDNDGLHHGVYAKTITLTLEQTTP